MPTIHTSNTPSGMNVALDPRLWTQVTMAHSAVGEPTYEIACRGFVMLEDGPAIVANRVSWRLLEATDEAGRVLPPGSPQSSIEFDRPAWRAQLSRVFDDYLKGTPRDQSSFEFKLTRLDHLPRRLARVRLAGEVLVCDGLALHEHAVSFAGEPVAVGDRWRVVLRPIDADMGGQGFDIRIEPAFTDVLEPVEPPLVALFVLLDDSGGAISDSPRFDEVIDGGVRVLRGRVMLGRGQQGAVPARWRLALAVEPRVERFEVVLADIRLPVASH